MKQSVYTAIKTCEKGFTLLSMLLIMTILFITLPLLSHLVNAITYTSSYDEISVQHFFQYLRDEFILATDYSVENNRLTLRNLEERRVSFEKYKNEVIRKVDNTGHDIYLRDIKDINFVALPFGVQVEITSLGGNTYEKTIVFYE